MSNLNYFFLPKVSVQHLFDILDAFEFTQLRVLSRRGDIKAAELIFQGAVNVCGSSMVGFVINVIAGRRRVKTLDHVQGRRCENRRRGQNQLRSLNPVFIDHERFRLPSGPFEVPIQVSTRASTGLPMFDHAIGARIFV